MLIEIQATTSLQILYEFMVDYKSYFKMYQGPDGPCWGDLNCNLVLQNFSWQELLKSLNTTFNPQEHAKTPKTKLQAGVLYTSLSTNTNLL